MMSNKPDPLGIQEAKRKAIDDWNLIWKYYSHDYMYDITTSDGAFRRYKCGDVVVTDWHRTPEECHAEMADKIRQWEKDNPELAIKDEPSCSPAT